MKPWFLLIEFNILLIKSFNPQNQQISTSLLNYSLIVHKTWSELTKPNHPKERKHFSFDHKSHCLHAVSKHISLNISKAPFDEGSSATACVIVWVEGRNSIGRLVIFGISMTTKESGAERKRGYLLCGKETWISSGRKFFGECSSVGMKIFSRVECLNLNVVDFCGKQKDISLKT